MKIEEDLHGPHYVDGPGGKILLIRKSMIEDFISCPWKFKRVWIDGVKKIPNQDMLVGTRYHDFMHTFFTHMMPADLWDDLIPPGYFIQKEEDWLRWTIGKERERYEYLNSVGRGDEFMPVKLEFRMRSLRLFLESTVDRAEWYDRSKDQICLVEYKTGENVNWQSVKRQLAFYAILWDDVVGLGKVTHLKLINPNAQVYQIVSFDLWEKDHMFKTIGNIRKAMTLGDYPHKCHESKHPYCMLCTPAETGLFPEDDGLTFTESLRSEG